MQRLPKNEINYPEIAYSSSFSFKASVKKKGDFKEIEFLFEDLSESEISLYNYFTSVPFSFSTSSKSAGIELREKIEQLHRVFHKTYPPEPIFNEFKEQQQEISGFVDSNSYQLPWAPKNSVIGDVLSMESKKAFELGELKEWTMKTISDVEDRFKSSESKACMDLLGIEYEKLILKDCIHKSCVASTDEGRPYSVAKSTLDVNGMKVAMDYSKNGHEAGRELLRNITMILKNGRTVRFLELLNVQVYSFMEGGDEFGMILFSQKDLRPALGFINELIIKEIENTDVSYLLDLGSSDLEKLFSARGVKPLPEDKFILSCSFGWSILGEVLDGFEFFDNENYVQALDRMCKAVMVSADVDGARNKGTYRRNLLVTGRNALHAMYTLQSDADYVLGLKERIIELENENNRLKDRIVELSC